MVEVNWTDQAIADMANIATFIGRDSKKYAEVQLKRFFHSHPFWKDIRSQGELYRN